jgi:hypothetical protein
MRTFALLFSILYCVTVHAQQTFPTSAASDDVGFESIFDGKTLKDWDGDAKYWRVEDGRLSARSRRGMRLSGTRLSFGGVGSRGILS